MALAFDQQSQEKIKTILGRYPNTMAACLPLLYLAQEEFGHLSTEAMDLVAKTLELPPSHVYGVATFYTMYNKREVGRYHVQVCTNVSCMLCGGYDVKARMEAALGIRCGETTNDGMFTLSEVECLAYCGSAPVVQVNDEIHELVSPDKVEDLVDRLRSGTGQSS